MMDFDTLRIVPKGSTKSYTFIEYIYMRIEEAVDKRLGKLSVPSDDNQIEVKYGNGMTEYGPGVEINLTGNDVAIAIDEYLESRGIIVNGPRTIKVNGDLCEVGYVYVDPSGEVIANGERYSGRGPNK